VTKKGKHRTRLQRKKERVVTVHPNSMAARKWGRTTWRTRTLD
jgi:hypothetical protein